MARKKATMDGNMAAAHVAYALTEVASIYPITPSSTMAELIDEWASADRRNIFGERVEVVEMQSEAGAAGALHGALSSGALGATFTASQGLLLMIPNMYKIAGEQLPGVLHVTARTLAAHALSIFGDHSDVMACAQTGFAMLASASVQECMDLAAVAHLSALKGSVPFMHFFDGFRTSHEQQKIEIWDYEELAEMVDQEALARFRARGLNPAHPVIRGTNQNPDIFFQAREASTVHYADLPAIIKEYMAEVSRRTGRNYVPYEYYGAADATEVVVAMGSVCEVAQQAVDALNAAGRKVGLVQVRLYRPFLNDEFLAVIPDSVKKIAVLDRVKTPGTIGGPLYADVCAAVIGARRNVEVIGGRYGLGSKDTVPNDIIGVFDNLALEAPKNNFTISIVDDVLNSSIPSANLPEMLPEGTIQCKFWGLGSDGTVGANKEAVKIIGGETDLYAQAYFAYDSKKSGGLTISHLRFGKEEIKAPYYIHEADFVSCSNKAYVKIYDMLADIREGGTFLLNCNWDVEELAANLPNSMKRALAEKKVNMYTIDALSEARAIGLGNYTNMLMQAAFFKLAKVIPEDVAVNSLDHSIEKMYGMMGEDIVKMNQQAVRIGMEKLVKVEIPAEWANAGEDAPADNTGKSDFQVNVMEPMIAQKGDQMPVSAFLGVADGTFPHSGSRLEKRGVSAFVPKWDAEGCIQCNRCSMVCPHAAIRPILVTADEKAAAPEAFVTKKATGSALADYQFRIQVSPMDCLGCEACVEVCPTKDKNTLTMYERTPQDPEIANWDYAMSVSSKDEVVAPTNVKNAQFKQPLLEFSGACAGCGETPYAKLITQLFGDRMVIANATGCSSIWGAAVPAMPYTVNHKGQGPAWNNSLFEDNAEFCLGINLGLKKQQQNLAAKAEAAIAEGKDAAINELLTEWIAGRRDAEISARTADALIPMLEASAEPCYKALLEQKDDFVKKSVWAFGGDGWAYDIGYGGVDHVLASGEDVNIFVFDTEVYSNTGGQSSKSTPAAAIAKFASSGKRVKKKDLGMMAMSYGYVYVAQIAMGADMNQTLKAIREAEAYPGPSLIIAYSTCINHGIKGGLRKGMPQMQKAVECGYWHLYRFNPAAEQKFVLDSKEPQPEKLQDFLMSEVRYSSLCKISPESADELFAKTANDAKERYESYLRMAGK